MQSTIAAPTGGRLSRDRIISVEFGQNNERVRKVVSRSNARATGKWPSWKLGRMAHYDSLHECNGFKLLDAWPLVRTYAEQPCTVHYLLDGEPRRHIPDILVDLGDRRELWEVKTAADARDPDVIRRTALMAAGLPAFGYAYRLAIAEDLGSNPRLGNIELLLRQGRQPVTIVQQEKIRRLFSQGSALPWGFFQAGEPGEAYRRHVCRLILEGVLAIDIDRPWDSSTAVLWNNGKGDASWVSLR